MITRNDIKVLFKTYLGKDANEELLDEVEGFILESYEIGYNTGHAEGYEQGIEGLEEA